MSSVDLVVPDIGNFVDILVVDVLVKPGDSIEVDAPLVTLETDKASMDVPATSAGTVTEVLLKAGDKVSKGTVIARVDASAQAASTGGDTGVGGAAVSAGTTGGANARGGAGADSSTAQDAGADSDAQFSAAFDADELERTVTQPVLGASAANVAGTVTSPASTAKADPKPTVASRAGKSQASPAANGDSNARPDGSGDTVRMPIPDLSRRDRAEVEFNRSTQLLVLGSGPGGYTAAFRAADLGLQVTWLNAGRPSAVSASMSAAFLRRRSCTPRRSLKTPRPWVRTALRLVRLLSIWRSCGTGKVPWSRS